MSAFKLRSSGCRHGISKKLAEFWPSGRQLFAASFDALISLKYEI
jgi:hypothetical protein